jgi:hypothetical protein
MTLQTEKILSTGAKTGHKLRLNPQEQEYVFTQLMQQNFNKRQGNAVFKSRTMRSTFTDNKQAESNPPPGLYEPKFNSGTETSPYNDPKRLGKTV